MKHQLAGGACGVDVFRDALEGNTTILQRGDGLNKVLQRPAKPIKPPDNERISFPKMRDRRCQSWPLLLGTGYLIRLLYFAISGVNVILLGPTPSSG